MARTESPNEASGVAEPLDLNRASREQLLSVMGLGPKTAAQILECRERNGPFRSVDDLAKLPIVTAGELERFRAYFKV